MLVGEILTSNCRRAFELINFDVRVLLFPRCLLTEPVRRQRVVLLDADMIVMRNMDELFDMDLPKDSIAAAHVCACNPRKLAHYPADWSVLVITFPRFYY